MTHTIRRKIETEIITALLTESLAAGYRVAVDNGGGEEYPEQTVEAILAAMFASNQNWLFYRNEPGKSDLVLRRHLRLADHYSN